VTGIAVVPPLVFGADPLAALIALAALAASRRDRVPWIGTDLVFAATAATTRRDARPDPENSLVQALFCRTRPTRWTSPGCRSAYPRGIDRRSSRRRAVAGRPGAIWRGVSTPSWRCSPT
jgi:hypothetical protein